MKKHLTFAMFLILAVALTSPFSVSAKTKAGAKPGSFFYFFDKIFERADLFFTFNPEKKAKKALEHADERLAEAEESANENDQKAVETAMKDYQENISLAGMEAKAIKDETKTKDLLSIIASSTSKHQEILTEVLNKVPEQAKQAIQKAIEASKKGMEKADEKTTELKKEVSEIKPEIEETKGKPENKKDEQKKEVETLKQKVIQSTSKQSTPTIQNPQEAKETEEAKNNTEQTTKKLQVEIQKTEEDFARLLEGKEEITAKSQQPRLISFKDNLGNIYTEEKNFARKASEPFNHGFGASYSPTCLQGISAIIGDCQSEIVNWVNNRSVEIGKSLNIALDSFDANDDDVFYYISYGSRNDWGHGNMRVLQSWGTNKTFSFPITEQLYNETLFENLGWSSTFFETETRKYYDKNVKLNNAGELNIQVCFNDKAEKMIDSFGEQFPDGCILFKYFILKPGYSELTTSTQVQ